MSRPPEEGFLSRWSRRKREEEEEIEDTPPTDAAPQTADEAPPDETEEELLARLDLPDPDTLAPGDDFSRFMAAAVPEHLRRRALRRLWRSNPTLAVLDGLNDYDDDFSGGFVAPGTLKTAYEVGRGIVSKVADAGGATPDQEQEATNAPDEFTQEQSAEAVTPGEPSEEEAEPDQQKQDDTTPDPRPTRRRMQFRVSRKD